MFCLNTAAPAVRRAFGRIGYGFAMGIAGRIFMILLNGIEFLHMLEGDFVEHHHHADGHFKNPFDGQVAVGGGIKIDIEL